MNDVNYLVGSPDLCTKPLPVYSDEACQFITAFSAALLRDGAAKRMPDVMSLAFWCRKGNLAKQREAFVGKSERLGRGLALHIAPANVPVNFAFSYVFSLLAGNANLVRVPSKPFPQVAAICRVLTQVLPEHPEVAKRSAFVSYPSTSAATATFSAQADARVIWGGNATVGAVRALPCKPRCIDLVFADRYSLCILDGKAVAAAEDATLARLAQSFYNDTYLMDQNACSSPQLICWQNASEASKTRFWNAVTTFAGESYTLQAAVAVDKFTQACTDAVTQSAVKAISHTGNILYRAELTTLSTDSQACLRGTGGYFYEYDLPTLDALAEVVTEQFQTITYFGVEPALLRDWVIQNRLRGIDRIVPVGAAMDIGVIWDGYDIIAMLSRILHTT